MVQSSSSLESSRFDGMCLKSDGGHANEGHDIVGESCSYESAFQAALYRPDTLDYTSWISLINSLPKADIMVIRKVFDAFLTLYPLCYKWWKVYADHERRVDSQKEVEVYERSTADAPFSVHIWCNYCGFLVSSQASEPDKIRRQFEKGLKYVGTDYHSNILWDEYINFEKSQKNWSNVAKIYGRILKHPKQNFDYYFKCFKDLIQTHQTIHIDSDESVDGCSNEVTLKDYSAAVEMAYMKAKAYEKKITSFEKAVKRTCFSVKPLDDSEIDSWHSYLDFMEAQGDTDKVSAFYERCIISCASYSEFWIRYVHYLTEKGKMEAATTTVNRATNIFFKNDQEFHIFSAKFKESNGDVPGAREGYRYIYSDLCPGMEEAIVRHANLERRQGNLECAAEIYKDAIASAKQKKLVKSLPSLLIAYARFILIVDDDIEKAKHTLSMLKQVDILTRQNIEDVISIEERFPGEKRIEFVDALVEKFLTPESTVDVVKDVDDKEEISTTFIEFVDRFGTSEQIRIAMSRHRTLFSCKRSTLLSKKRILLDDIAAGGVKRLKTNAPDILADTSEVLEGQYGGATLCSQACKKQGYAEDAVMESPSQLAFKETRPSSAMTYRFEEPKPLPVSVEPPHLPSETLQKPRPGEALYILCSSYDSEDDDYSDAGVT
ncbi:hypothetical protein QOZ80_3BG0290280 [Eleusine coracana subsp. coracana]|nr:hypothetical protein QOZ80_3BG0290280 [Eleusine coracana subsp. coracana]